STGSARWARPSSPTCGTAPPGPLEGRRRPGRVTRGERPAAAVPPGPSLRCTAHERSDRMRFAIDAATLLDLVESGRPVAPGHQLVAPAAVRSQALDLLLDRVRRGELDARQALARHDPITETKIRVLNDRVTRRVAWDL